MYLIELRIYVKDDPVTKEKAAKEVKDFIEESLCTEEFVRWKEVKDD